MKIKALVEKGDDEVEVEVNLPYYYKDAGPDIDGGNFGYYVKIDTDKVSSITWNNTLQEGETYVVQIDREPKDWRNTCDTHYFAGKKKNSLSAKGFEIMQKRASEWLLKQQELLQAIAA